MDVLSNLPFALFGLAGVWTLVPAVRQRAVGGTAAWLAGLFFVGLVVIAGVSAAYHWQPDNAGLFWDRGGMVLALGAGSPEAVQHSKYMELARNLGKDLQ